MMIETPTGAMARFGHALSDPTRTQILLLLASEARFPADLAEHLEVSRQVISNHLACLRGCGLVVASPVGRRSRYELSDPAVGAAVAQIHQLVLIVDPACAGGNAPIDTCSSDVISTGATSHQGTSRL